ncbi:PepSY-associated TM helix domain-containing protein [Novosphingobium sp. KACC 22771]|uniref:PepSY-associated TM helix domain-containing protein n=1 Tax=Novosphingobium sp. KACC 22771 TaxID=3025670 RepID=UPI002365F06A|nr:PepSY-associated TM helix domain-containing protein [Novosphingobium sp. KACC 22771]WDF73885.1 PepSY-associated TM helix domain-containing protein [Novosphingobium sp. KACC 22771]
MSKKKNGATKQFWPKQFWQRQFHTWHWISAAISLIGMLFFAITGITLNHAGAFAASPRVVDRNGQLSVGALRLLKGHAPTGPLPAPVASAVEQAVHIDISGRDAEWAEDAITVNLPRPGGDGFVSINPADGAITAELTDRGLLSLANDLHKGRNAGGPWVWFLDIFAGACVIFTLTGLLLLHLHSKRRPSTWPLVGLGLIVPLLLVHFLVP